MQEQTVNTESANAFQPYRPSHLSWENRTLIAVHVQAMAHLTLIGAPYALLLVV